MESGSLSGNVGRSQTQQVFDQLRKRDVQGFTSALATFGSSASNGHRTLSTVARKRINLAQKARWAKPRRGSQPGLRSAKATGLTIVKRTISATGRKRIAAAQRARWAKMKAGKNASKTPGENKARCFGGGPSTLMRNHSVRDVK
jgi:hypothetical protein